MIRRLLLALCCSFASYAAAGEIEEGVLARVRAAGLGDDAVGFVVQRLSDGVVVAAHNADRAMQPASTIKLVTSAVALERLGPAWRGRSELRAQAVVRDGVLLGNLHLRGLADLDLDWQALERMLHLARHQGIREIAGDVVVDRALFNPARTDVGVPPFDEAPEFRYNVIPDALLVNSNLMLLDLASDGTGVRVAVTPPLERVIVESDMAIVERACEGWEDGWKPPVVKQELRGILRVRLQGDFPRDCLASTSINVIDRAAFTDRLVRALWSRLGGKLKGRVRDGETPSDARVIAEHRSRPLGDLLRDINKRSDNPMTRMVFLALGTLPDGPPGEPTLLRADRQVRNWLERRDIDSTGLVLENGSGLSRRERIRPSQLAGLLRAAAASEWAPEFLASLPVVSVDGTMRNRLGGTPASGSARIKTGTLRDTAAIAGYVKDAGGETCVVVAFLNYPAATRAVSRPILDGLVDTVARYNTRR